jgi:hypothetical protein
MSSSSVGKQTSRALSPRDLVEIVGRDQDVSTAISRADPELVRCYSLLLEELFPQVFRAERSANRPRLRLLTDLYFTAAHGASAHLDETGITAAVGGLIHHLRRFSFETNAANLGFDHLYLTSRLGIPEDKVQHFWPYLDRRKERAIAVIGEKGFRLASTVKAARETFEAEGGEEWQRLSPGFWTRMAGYALGCANVGAALGSAGIATGLALASVAVGAVAVAAD